MSKSATATISATALTIPLLALQGLPAHAAADLSDVCPSPLVIQIDWLPQAEQGWIYNMLSDDYAVDKSNQRVTGKLMSQGADAGIEVEIRSGGPAIANMMTNMVAYTDPSIHVGIISVPGLVGGFKNAPMTAVLAPYEKSPTAIIWDPESYPDVQTIRDLKERNITVSMSPGNKAADALVALDQLSQGQLDMSYDSSPANFIASGGKFAQQAVVTNDPYAYEHVYKQWGKPVRHQLMYDAGFRFHFATASVRSGDLDELRPCLAKLVPVWQQSIVDYVTSPEATNKRIVDIVEAYDTFWKYTLGAAAYGAETMLREGLVSNGDDSTIGNFNPAIVEETVDILRRTGTAIPEGFSPDKIFTNEFVDPGIGLN